MHLIHVRLLVRNFDECFRFYRDVMRFEVGWGAEGEGYADFKTGDGATLALFQQEVMSEALGTTALPARAESQDTAALIFSVDDVDSTLEELRQRGAQAMSGPQDFRDWGIRAAHLRDPDGNLIEINSQLPHEDWSEELLEESQKYK